MNIGRRSFLGGLGAGAASFALARDVVAGEKPADVVRFCLFADLHYLPGEFPNDSFAFLDAIIERARTAKVDFIIHLGDLVHRSLDPRARAFVARYNACGLPAYHTIGNHENDGGTERDTLRLYGLPRGYYSFDVKGFRFIVCDCNYIRRRDGRVEHYSQANYFGVGEGDVTGWMPEEQIAWLARTIDEAPGACVVCSHQSFERERGGVPNWRAVRKVFDDANRAHPGRVRLVMNGHYHTDNLRILNGIAYYDVNSANYQWYNDKHSCYPAAYTKAHTMASHTLAWDRPLSAIVTLGSDGRIRVEGSRADWLFGVTPEKAKLSPGDDLGRPVAPVMQDINLHLMRSDEC